MMKKVKATTSKDKYESKSFVDPFDALVQMDELARKKKQSTTTAEADEHFVGIGFQADGFNFIIPHSEISEILAKPDIVQIPGVKPWLLGLINLHGNVILVSDLWDFLYGRKEPISDQAKIIIFRQEAEIYGLLIDHCLGIKRLKKTALSESQDTIGIRGDIKVFIDASYQEGEVQWLLLNLKKIIATPAFRRVSKEEAQGG